MCGRYRLSRRKQLIKAYFETRDEVDWEPRYRGCYETREHKSGKSDGRRLLSSVGR